MWTQAAWHSNFFLTLTLCTLHSGISNYRLRLLPNSGVLAPTAKCPRGRLSVHQHLIICSAFGTRVSFLRLLPLGGAGSVSNQPLASAPPLLGVDPSSLRCGHQPSNEGRVEGKSPISFSWTVILGQIDLGYFSHAGLSQAGLGGELSGPFQLLGQELMAGQPALYPQIRICSPLSLRPWGAEPCFSCHSDWGIWSWQCQV